MLLISHIIIALSSVFYSTYVFFAPSRTKLRAAYSLVAMTLATGTVLVVSTHSPLLSSCLSGLVYLAIVFAALVPASYKVAHAHSSL